MRVIAAASPAGQVAIEALARRQGRLAAYERQVRSIVKKVRSGGDAVLRSFAEKWDGLGSGEAIAVAPAEMAEAWRRTPRATQTALKSAAKNIRQFCQWQMPKEWMRELTRGVRVGQIVRPLASAGCYVPSGRYPLPSTLLMTVIPAQVAGVRHIAVASPNPKRETLAAAAMLGVKRFYRVGGAQAIAALAYGTESVARVEKIVGPGNSYVTAAKKQVAFDCAIDMLAGPTEALIVAGKGNARSIAADLVAQAEHDVESACLFVTWNRSLAEAVAAEALSQAQGNATAMESLSRNGLAVVTKNATEALTIANLIASEHLTVMDSDLSGVESAGSVFVGESSAQSFGDYCAGPNHVLPTNGYARLRGGLSVNDFVKVISVQKVSRAGAARLGPTAVRLAEAEGLTAHAASIRVRTKC